MSESRVHAPLLEVRGLRKYFGGLRACDDVSFSVEAGEIHAVIGPNGAGKTTLLAQIAGDLRHDAGEIRFRGSDVGGLETAERVRRGIARSFQIVTLFDDFSAVENLALAIRARRGGSAGWWRHAADDPNVRTIALALLERVGLAQRADATAATLAHGERRALDIALALACEPSLLLLDEPMAGLGAQESRAMLELLASLRGSVTMLLVEHDLEAVFALAERVTVLEFGRVIASADAASVRADAAVQRAYLGTEFG